MRYIKLQDNEIETLEEAVRNHPNRFLRNRSQCLLSSHRGVPVKHLALTYHVRTRTIYYWFDRWRTMGLVGLMNLPGQGRKPTLDVEDQELVKKALAQVKENSLKLSAAAEQLSVELGRKVTKGILKRLVKKKDIAGDV
jgi:transposase